MRVALNYEIRSAEAPNFPAGAGPNANVEGIDDRIGIQVTGIWSNSYGCFVTSRERYPEPPLRVTFLSR